MPIQSFRSDILQLADGSSMYWEASGNPALYLHGGPGSACQTGYRQQFDPAIPDRAVRSERLRTQLATGNRHGLAPEGIVAQTELVWQNIFAALKAGGMRPEDLVKTTANITRREDVAEYVKVRAKYLAIFVRAKCCRFEGNIKPEYLIDVDAIAAAK